MFDPSVAPEALLADRNMLTQLADRLRHSHHLSDNMNGPNGKEAAVVTEQMSLVGLLDRFAEMEQPLLGVPAQYNYGKEVKLYPIEFTSCLSDGGIGGQSGVKGLAFVALRRQQEALDMIIQRFSATNKNSPEMVANDIKRLESEIVQQLGEIRERVKRRQRLQRYKALIVHRDRLAQVMTKSSRLPPRTVLKSGAPLPFSFIL